MTALADIAATDNHAFSVAKHTLKARKTLVCSIVGSAFVLAMLVLAGLGFGAVLISPIEALSIGLSKLGLPTLADFTTRDDLILSAIRAPRTALGALAGGALAVSGAALQGLFRNPLADPTLIGVSSGAALGAVAVIVLGTPVAALLPAALQSSLLPAAAFVGGLAAIGVVHVIARHDGGTNIATLLLAGAAVTAICGAGVGLFIFLGDDQQIRDINFWLLGSLSGANWQALGPAAVLICIGMFGVLRFGAALDALSLGEADAHHLGFEPEKLKHRLIIFCALATGAAVSLTGVIGFVGLVTPHIVRMLIGPAHRALLPTSLLLGGALMLAADILSRTVAAPAELPIGIVTAAIGGPFFLWLLVRGRAHGGW
jgi:iron complex transport system permease protein